MIYYAGDKIVSHDHVSGDLLHNGLHTTPDRFHTRSAYSDTDQTKVFSSYYCSEKPNRDLLRGSSTQLQALREEEGGLDYDQLEPNERTIHFLRQYAKKGKYPDESFVVDPTFNAPDDIIEDRIKAAKWVVDQLLTDEHVGELAEHLHKRLDGRTNQTVTILRNQVAEAGDVSYNFLSPTYDEMLIEKLKDYFADHYPEDQIDFDMQTALRLNDTLRVYSTPVERLARLPFIDTEDLSPKVDGKLVLIADEHVQSAGMTSTLFSLSKQLGAEVMGITTLTSHPTTQDISLSPEVRDLVIDYANETSKDGAETLEDTLETLGLSLGTISNREGLYILALLMDGEEKDQFDQLVDLERRLATGSEVVEGVEDNVRRALTEPSLTVEDLKDQIETLVQHRPDHFYTQDLSL